MRSPGRTSSTSPGTHLRHRHVDLLARRAPRARVCGCSSTSARSAADVLPLRARLERVAREHERDDDDHRLVVQVGRDAVRREESRRERRDQEYTNAAPVPTAMSVFMSAEWCGAPATRARRSAGRPTPSRRRRARAARTARARDVAAEHRAAAIATTPASAAHDRLARERSQLLALRAVARLLLLERRQIDRRAAPRRSRCRGSPARARSGVATAGS